MTTLAVSEKPLKKVDGRGKHPNSLKNLKSGYHGQNHNPQGYSILARAKQKLRETCPFDAQGRNWHETLAETLLKQGLIRTEGMSQILNRFEGPVPGEALPPNINVIFVVGKGYRELPQLAEGNNDHSG